MSRNDDDFVVPKYVFPATGTTPPAAAVREEPVDGRLTLAAVLPIIAFPVMGSVLNLAGGMPMGQVFQFLTGCGAIGAAVTVSVTSGRRFIVGLARAVLTAGNK